MPSVYKDTKALLQSVLSNYINMNWMCVLFCFYDVWVARAIIQPGPDVAGTVIEGGHQYYQYDCGTLSDMLLVEITDAVGTAFLYCSTVEPNPGPLTANTTSNEQLSVSRRSCTIQTNSTQVCICICMWQLHIVPRLFMKAYKRSALSLIHT